eukprot:GHVQ01010322.1.p1 GENE.GHVQ01010322.1~~GHVQ01010322.1.p1  ORF type:complete len:2008 (+),score=250.23 GHVQ01010322.1:650-6025(+)
MRSSATELLRESCCYPPNPGNIADALEIGRSCYDNLHRHNENYEDVRQDNQQGSNYHESPQITPDRPPAIEEDALLTSSSDRNSRASIETAPWPGMDDLQLSRSSAATSPQLMPRQRASGCIELLFEDGEEQLHSPQLKSQHPPSSIPASDDLCDVNECETETFSLSHSEPGGRFVFEEANKAEQEQQQTVDEVQASLDDLLFAEDENTEHEDHTDIEEEQRPAEQSHRIPSAYSCGVPVSVQSPRIAPSNAPAAQHLPTVASSNEVAGNRLSAVGTIDEAITASIGSEERWLPGRCQSHALGEAPSCVDTTNARELNLSDNELVNGTADGVLGQEIDNYEEFYPKEVTVEVLGASSCRIMSDASVASPAAAEHSEQAGIRGTVGPEETPDMGGRGDTPDMGGPEETQVVGGLEETQDMWGPEIQDARGGREPHEEGGPQEAPEISEPLGVDSSDVGKGLSNILSPSLTPTGTRHRLPQPRRTCVESQSVSTEMSNKVGVSVLSAIKEEMVEHRSISSTIYPWVSMGDTKKAQPSMERNRTRTNPRRSQHSPVVVPDVPYPALPLVNLSNPSTPVSPFIRRRTRTRSNSGSPLGRRTRSTASPVKRCAVTHTTPTRPSELISPMTTPLASPFRMCLTPTATPAIQSRDRSDTEVPSPDAGDVEVMMLHGVHSMSRSTTALTQHLCPVSVRTPPPEPATADPQVSRRSPDGSGGNLPFCPLPRGALSYHIPLPSVAATSGAGQSVSSGSSLEAPHCHRSEKGDPTICHSSGGVRSAGDCEEAGEAAVQESSAVPAAGQRGMVDRSLLYGFQEQALNWMLSREACPAVKLHPQVGFVDCMDNHGSCRHGAELRNADCTSCQHGESSAFSWSDEGGTEICMPGGVLADEAGLGKTMCVLALISEQVRAARRHTSLRHGVGCTGALQQQPAYANANDGGAVLGHPATAVCRTLIVCPAALMQQWVREVRKYCCSLSVYVHGSRGSIKGLGPTQLREFDIVLTSYNAIAACSLCAPEHSEKASRRAPGLDARSPGKAVDVRDDSLDRRSELSMSESASRITPMVGGIGRAYSNVSPVSSGSLLQRRRRREMLSPGFSHSSSSGTRQDNPNLPLSRCSQGEDTWSATSSVSQLPEVDSLRLTLFGGNREMGDHYLDIENDSTQKVCCAGDRQITAPDRTACSCGLHLIVWHRIFLDEAHCIVKSNTRQARGIRKLRGKYKWCVTATPLVNKVKDVAELLAFVASSHLLTDAGVASNGSMPPTPVIASSKHVTRPSGINGTPASTENGIRGLSPEELKKLWNAVSLRRTQAELRRIAQSAVPNSPEGLSVASLQMHVRLPNTLTTTPLPFVPPLPEVKYRLCPLTFQYDAEQEQYATIAGTVRHQLTRYDKDTGRCETLNSLEALTRLRQACLHPELIAVNSCTGRISFTSGQSTPDSSLSPKESPPRRSIRATASALLRGDGKIYRKTGSNSEFTPTNASAIAVDESDDGSVQVNKTTDNVRDVWQSGSSKIDALLEEVTALYRSFCPEKYICSGSPHGPSYTQRSCRGETEDAPKCLVISAFTEFLDIVERCVRKRYRSVGGVSPDSVCVTIKGSQTLLRRHEMLGLFRSDPKVRVCLLSALCSAQGLNLQAASYVYIMDPFFNHSKTEQAIGRSVRIGQRMNAVTIVQFFVNGTVEERLLSLQDTKRKRYQSLWTGSSQQTNSDVRSGMQNIDDASCDQRLLPTSGIGKVDAPTSRSALADGDSGATRNRRNGESASSVIAERFRESDDDEEAGEDARRTLEQLDDRSLSFLLDF